MSFVKRSGDISLVQFRNSTSIEWKDASINTADMEYHNTEFRSPDFLYNKKTWFIRLEKFYLETAGETSYLMYFRLRIFDKHDHQSLSENWREKLISRAEIKTVYGNSYNFTRYPNGFLLFPCNEFPDISCNNVVTVFVELCSNQESVKSESSRRAKITSSSACKQDRGLDAMSQNFKDLYLSEKFSDFAIKIGHRRFQVHTTVLAARSPVFAAMLEHDMAETRNREIDVTDCEPEAFEEFLLYLYSGKAELLSDENVPGVFIIADKYRVDVLRTECSDYMKMNLSVDSFCETINLAVKYDEGELIKASKEFFVKNSRKIVSGLKWQSLMKECTTLASELILLLTPGN